MAILPFRQVHLDFHTSPAIADVGVDFDATEFARTLKEAAVNSVTVFARCHHGMSYYPTKVGTVHPSLKRDLLGEMIEACHKEGIQAPIYMTVVWDEDAGTKHPEWRQVDPGGCSGGTADLQQGMGLEVAVHELALCRLRGGTDRRDLQGYPVDGMFYDIVMQKDPGCVCNYCLASMKKLGLNPTSAADLKKHTLIVGHNFMQRMTGIVHASHPKARIFYNSRMRLDPEPDLGVQGECRPTRTGRSSRCRPVSGATTTSRSLPATFRRWARRFLGMTGRFHLSWADFGGFKNQAALEYECFRHLALGAANSIGDQLHPRGRIDQAAYDLIGSVYRQVEAVEPWCVDADRWPTSVC